MVGLLDFKPPGQTFSLGGKDIAVPGLTFGHIRDLVARFPKLGELLQGKTVMASDIVSTIPDAVPAIIATGFGFPADKEQEAAASKMTIGVQIDMIDAVIKATEPSGEGPLSKKLRGLLADAVPAAPQVPSITSSDKPSGG